MQRPAEKSWFWWNLANILSLLRLIGPAVFFGPWFSFREKVVGYVLLTFTDLIDGWLAKKIGNYGGMGKLIDMVPDKVLHISFFLLLLFSGKLDYFALSLMIMVVIQEIRIALLVIEAVNLVAESELRAYASFSRKERIILACKKVRDGIIEKVNANEFGRWKMVVYSLGGYFYLSFIVIENSILYWQSLFLFTSGLVLSFIAHRKYKFDFEKWKHDFLGQA